MKKWVVMALPEAIFGKSFSYDYCSIGHSLEVYEDTASIFNEVFGSYNVPIDATMCPFHADNLAYIRQSQQLVNWSQVRLSNDPITLTCPVCSKTFKSLDFYALHLKKEHSEIDPSNHRLKLG